MATSSSVGATGWRATGSVPGYSTAAAASPAHSRDEEPAGGDGWGGRGGRGGVEGGGEGGRGAKRSQTGTSRSGVGRTPASTARAASSSVPIRRSS